MAVLISSYKNNNKWLTNVLFRMILKLLLYSFVLPVITFIATILMLFLICRFIRNNFNENIFDDENQPPRQPLNGNIVKNTVIMLLIILRPSFVRIQPICYQIPWENKLSQELTCSCRKHILELTRNIFMITVHKESDTIHEKCWMLNSSVKPGKVLKTVSAKKHREYQNILK